MFYFHVPLTNKKIPSSTVAGAILAACPCAASFLRNKKYDECWHNCNRVNNHQLRRRYHLASVAYKNNSRYTRQRYRRAQAPSRCARAVNHRAPRENLTSWGLARREEIPLVNAQQLQRYINYTCCWIKLEIFLATVTKTSKLNI